MNLDINEIKNIVEAILFASGDSVSLEKIAETIEIDKKTLQKILLNMELEYKRDNRGIQLKEINGKYQLCTKEKYFDYVQRIIEPRANKPLSQAALETLSIIAYNQPITRSKIEKIRGVNSDSSISKLLERDLIYVSGKLEVLGKPRLYKTTEEFLRVFGIRNINELPELDENIDHTFFEVNDEETEE